MTLNDWQRVAREFGDHHIGGWHVASVKADERHTVGDWLPSEPTAKEILRLRRYAPQPLDESMPTYAQLVQDLDREECENDRLRERVKHLEQVRDRLLQRREVLERTIRWALGEAEMDGWFPSPNDDSPWFYWRSGLRRRAALDAAKEAADG